MIIEIKKGEGITELKHVSIWKDVKEILLVLSVLLPNVLGFVFLVQLLCTGAGFLIYWGIVYGWTLLFTYAQFRKRKDRSTGRRTRS